MKVMTKGLFFVTKEDEGIEFQTAHSNFSNIYSASTSAATIPSVQERDARDDQKNYKAGTIKLLSLQCTDSAVQMHITTVYMNQLTRSMA
jgi:hypothetical protein